MAAALVGTLSIVVACESSTTGNTPQGTQDAGQPNGDAGTPDAGHELTGTIVYAAQVEELGYLPQVFSMKPDGTEIHQLTTTDNPVLPFGVNDQPTMSPDGKMIVFSSGRDVQGHGAVNPTLRQLYVMNADGTNVHKLTTHEQRNCSEHNAQFSPDGTWITYSATCDDTVDTTFPFKEHSHRVKLDGTGDENLTTDDGNQTHPVYTADGKSVLYVQITNDSMSEIYSVNVETKATTQLTHANAKTRNVVGAAMPSPDGKHILFITKADTTNGGSEAPKLEQIASDGSAHETLRDLGTLDSPAWYMGVSQDADWSLSPDGEHLIFVSFLDANADPTTYAVMISNLDGSDRKALTPANDGYAHPIWK